MFQLVRVMGLGILAIALVVGVGQSQDAKKDKEPGKKGTVPAGWKGLKLTKEQREKVVAIGAAFDTKIADLQKQIDDLKAQRRAEQVKVLTAEQKAILLKGLAGEEKNASPKDKAPPKDKEK